MTELLGGRHRRQLTKGQRNAIADLLEEHDVDDPKLRAKVARVIEGHTEE